MAAAAEATPRYRPEHIKGRGGHTRFRLEIPAVGETYNSLTVIGNGLRTDNHGRRYWTFRCECGTVKEHIASKVIGGHIKSCGCQKIERQRLAVTKYADPLTKYRNTLMAGYKRHASARRFSFELEAGEFHSMTQKPCVYCGTINGSSHSKRYGGLLAYNGIDRIDSTLGYTADNTAPCCKTCNMMKQRLTQKEFILHIRKILAHYCRKGEAQYVV